MGGLIVLNAWGAEAAEQPLRVLYIGPVESGGGGRGGNMAGSRTNYVYLPGQTLAAEAIYFDHLTSSSNLTSAYLKHFDAVALVSQETALSAGEHNMLATFRNEGKPILKYSKPATDSVMREALLAKVSEQARSGWEALLAARPPLQRLPGEVPNYERRPEPVNYQLPLSPADSIRYTQVPADFEMQL
ncbi:MAG: hypothetical protein ACO1QB_04700, partial [Verrucomicrobiales bacterium]